MKMIYIFLGLLSITSCDVKHQDYNKVNGLAGKDSLEVCEIVKNVSVNLNLINQNPKILLKGADKCVIALLDSLTSIVIYTNDVRHLQSLDVLCSESDGYVSEYFLDISLKLFYKNFNVLFDHIYQKRNASANCLKERLIEAISMELADADDAKIKKKEIEDYIAHKSKQFSKEQKDFLDKIKNQFNPTLFE